MDPANKITIVRPPVVTPKIIRPVVNPTQSTAANTTLMPTKPQAKPVFSAQAITPPTVRLQETPVVKGKPHTGGLLRQFGGATSGVMTQRATPGSKNETPNVKITEETGYSLLMKLSNVWDGTHEKATQLDSLKYKNGHKIIDIGRRDVIGEIIGMLRINTFEYVISFITDAPSPEYILWNQKSLDEGRIKVAREIMIQQAEEVGVKGVGKCRYCSSTELTFALKQLRSGDEPANIFVRCVMCNKHWQQ